MRRSLLVGSLLVVLAASCSEPPPAESASSPSPPSSQAPELIGSWTPGTDGGRFDFIIDAPGASGSANQIDIWLSDGRPPVVPPTNAPTNPLTSVAFPWHTSALSGKCLSAPTANFPDHVHVIIRVTLVSGGLYFAELDAQQGMPCFYVERFMQDPPPGIRPPQPQVTGVIKFKRQSASPTKFVVDANTTYSLVTPDSIGQHRPKRVDIWLENTRSHLSLQRSTSSAVAWGVDSDSDGDIEVAGSAFNRPFETTDPAGVFAYLVVVSQDVDGRTLYWRFFATPVADDANPDPNNINYEFVLFPRALSASRIPPLP